MMVDELTQVELKRLISYDPDTGEFIRLTSSSSSARAGDVAGYLKADGYRSIKLNRKSYPAHRLAFLYMTGEFPPDKVDHINGDTSDNRWINIRPVSHQENLRNKKIYSNNTSGTMGVTWSKVMSKWLVRIKIDSKYKSLGYYQDKKQAISVRRQAESDFGFHQNHGKRT